MPKKAVSSQAQMDLEFTVALAAGQARLGDKNTDTAKYLPNCQRVFYKRIKEPDTFTLCDLRILAKRYGWTDRQVCKIIGVEYRGRTLEQEAV